MSATDRGAVIPQDGPSETENRVPPSESPASSVPLLFDKRVLLSSRQAVQFKDTDTELDPKGDSVSSDVNAKENIIAVAWAGAPNRLGAGPADL